MRNHINFNFELESGTQILSVVVVPFQDQLRDLFRVFIDGEPGLLLWKDKNKDNLHLLDNPHSLDKNTINQIMDKVYEYLQDTEQVTDINLPSQSVRSN